MQIPKEIEQVIDKMMWDMLKPHLHEQEKWGNIKNHRMGHVMEWLDKGELYRKGLREGYLLTQPQ